MSNKEKAQSPPQTAQAFDLDTPYQTKAQKQAWRRFLQGLDARAACRLCGLDHFPHWLAAAANWLLLTRYLSRRYPGEMSVTDALVRAIRERRPDPMSEHSAWWRAMEHLAPELERFARLYTAGMIRPMSSAIMEQSPRVADGQGLGQPQAPWPVDGGLALKDTP